MPPRLPTLLSAAPPFLPRDRADELCRNLAGADDETTLTEVADAIERRRQHFGLRLADGDVGPLAKALFAALALEQVAA